MLCDLNREELAIFRSHCSLCFTHGLVCLIFRYAFVTGAGSVLGRDIALGLAATDYRLFSAAVSSDVSLDFNYASDNAITEPI
jgi:hypothetical protein